MRWHYGSFEELGRTLPSYELALQSSRPFSARRETRHAANAHRLAPAQVRRNASVGGHCKD